MQRPRQAHARASLPLAHETRTRHAGEGMQWTCAMAACCSWGCIHAAPQHGALTHLQWTDAAMADRERERQSPRAA